MTHTRHSMAAARPHFVTCTIVGHVPVLARPEVAQKVLDSLRELQDPGRIVVYGYVVLEDHLHLIASGAELAKQIDAFEASSSAAILAALDNESARSVRKQLLRHAVASPQQGSPRVWQPRENPQVMATRETMQQKLAFLHDNPVKRGYVNDPTLWRYSSARNYAGQPGLLPVTTDW